MYLGEHLGLYTAYLNLTGRETGRSLSQFLYIKRHHRITMHGRCLFLVVLLVQSVCFYQLGTGTLPSHDHVVEYEPTTTEPVTDIVTTTTEHEPDEDLIP